MLSPTARDVASLGLIVSGAKSIVVLALFPAPSNIGSELSIQFRKWNIASRDAEWLNLASVWMGALTSS